MGICGSATKTGTEAGADVTDPAKLKGTGTTSSAHSQNPVNGGGKKEGPSTGITSQHNENMDMPKPKDMQTVNKDQVNRDQTNRDNGDKPTFDNRDVKPRSGPGEELVYVKPGKDKKAQDKTAGKRSQMQSQEASRDGFGDAAHGGRADKRKAKVIDVVDDKESGYFETFTKVEKRKTAEDTAVILNSLHGHFFFSNISNEEL